MIPVCNFEIIAKPADFYLADYQRNPEPPASRAFANK